MDSISSAFGTSAAACPAAPSAAPVAAHPAAPSAFDGTSAPAVKSGGDDPDDFSSVLLTKKLETVRKEMESENDNEILSIMVTSLVGTPQQTPEPAGTPGVEDGAQTVGVSDAPLSAAIKGTQPAALSLEMLPARPLPVSPMQLPSASAITQNRTAQSAQLPDIVNSSASSLMEPSKDGSTFILHALDEMACQLLTGRPDRKEAHHSVNQMPAGALQQEAAESSDAAGMAVVAAAKRSPAMMPIVRSMEYQSPECEAPYSLLLQKIDEAVSRVAVKKDNGDISEALRTRLAAPSVSEAAIYQTARDEADNLLLTVQAAAPVEEQMSIEGNGLLSPRRITGNSTTVDQDMSHSLFRPFHESLVRELSGTIKEHRAFSEPGLRIQISDLIRQVSGAMESPRRDEFITVRLDPPTLGEVSVKVVVENSRMSVQFSVSDRSVKSLIEENLSSLVQHCAEKGIAVGGFSVECRQGRNFQDFKPSTGGKGSDGEVEEIDGFKSGLTDYAANRVNVRV